MADWRLEQDKELKGGHHRSIVRWYDWNGVTYRTEVRWRNQTFRHCGQVWARWNERPQLWVQYPYGLAPLTAQCGNCGRIKAFEFTTLGYDTEVPA